MLSLHVLEVLTYFAYKLCLDTKVGQVQGWSWSGDPCPSQQVISCRSQCFHFYFVSVSIPILTSLLSLPTLSHHDLKVPKFSFSLPPSHATALLKFKFLVINQLSSSIALIDLFPTTNSMANVALFSRPPSFYQQQQVKLDFNTVNEHSLSQQQMVLFFLISRHQQQQLSTHTTTTTTRSASTIAIDKTSPTRQQLINNNQITTTYTLNQYRLQRTRNNYLTHSVALAPRTIISIFAQNPLSSASPTCIIHFS